MRLVITGTSSGIGRALTGHFLARGHHVWGLARSDQAELAIRHPQTFRASRCDVADWGQLSRIARDIYDAWPHIDGLVCSAGLLGPIGAAMTLDPLHWSAAIRANLDGVYYTIRAFFELLRRAPRRAKIICFSGGGAAKARPNFSAYGAAKTGVVRLVETLAGEWRAEPVDINAIAPGAINTRLTDEVLSAGPAGAGEAEYQAALRQKETGGHSLEQAIGLVEWLLSPASDGISGRLLAAQWDPWKTLGTRAADLQKSDVYTLRRIVPEDRAMKF